MTLNAWSEKIIHQWETLIMQEHFSLGPQQKKNGLSLLPFLSWHHVLNFWGLLILFFHAWTTQREEVLHPFLLLVKKEIQNCFFCKNSNDSSVPFMIFFATDIFQPQDSRAFQHLTSFKLSEGQQQQTRSVPVLVGVETQMFWSDPAHWPQLMASGVSPWSKGHSSQIFPRIKKNCGEIQITPKSTILLIFICTVE